MPELAFLGGRKTPSFAGYSDARLQNTLTGGRQPPDRNYLDYKQLSLRGSYPLESAEDIMERPILLTFNKPTHEHCRVYSVDPIYK